jgi:hypothetical protein
LLTLDIASIHHARADVHNHALFEYNSRTTPNWRIIINTKPFVISKPLPTITDLPALGMDGQSIVEDFRRYFSRTLGRDKLTQATYYVYTSLSLSMRDRLVERWKKTQHAYNEQDCKRTYYLSLEFGGSGIR